MTIARVSPDHQARLDAGAACHQATLKYRALGLSPLILCDPHHTGIARINPKHADRCDSPGKAPIIAWKGFQDRLPTEAEINKWFENYPIGNVGTACGQAAGIVRIDADGEAGERLLQEASQGDLPKTWMFKTPASDPQRLYGWPRTVPCRSTAKRGDGEHNELRLMANGEQTVLPPSRHPRGGFYEWVEGHSPDDIPLEMAPEWLIERLRVDGGVVPYGEAAIPNELHDIDLATLNVTDDIRHLIVEGAPAGQDRSGPLFSVSKALIRAGCDDAIIASLLLNPEYGISSKPIEKGRRWLGQEIGRARAKVKTQDDGARWTVGANGNQHKNGDNTTSGRPQINYNTEVQMVTNQGQKAILDMVGGPHLYQRARLLCHIAKGVKAPKWMSRPSDAPVIIEASNAYIRELSTIAAAWLKLDRRSNKFFETLPPSWFVETLIGRASWPFPVLEGIVNTPTIRPDGSILDASGYDADTGLYLDLNGQTFPPIPNNPTLDDARTAIGRLQEPLHDFPFVDDRVHFSAALAAILSVVGRYAVQGNVPLFAVRSTTRGSGKGLLVDVASIIGIGRSASRWPQASDDDEERKRLLTLGLDGDPLVLIDNINQPLGSAALDAAITGMTFKDRVLGRTESREVPMNAVFFASGNNMVFKGDMARRVVPIDLDPKMEKPEERDDFRHAELLVWVNRNRPRLVTAALTILSAYYAAGQPAQDIKQYGSFEEWSAIIRAALVWCGEADPCEGRLDIEAESDPEFEAYCELLAAWHDCYGDKTRTLKQVINHVGGMAEPSGPPNKWNELKDALGAFDTRYEGKGLNSRKIGNAIRKWNGRVHGGKRLVKAGNYNRAIQWQVQDL